MEDVHAALKQLQLTVQKLLKSYINLKKENEGLRKNIEQTHRSLSEKEVIIKNIEQKAATINIVSSYNEEEKQLINSKIDYYLNDIKKCLDLLNS